jgi:hypothetical protein
VHAEGGLGAAVLVADDRAVGVALDQPTASQALASEYFTAWRSRKPKILRPATRGPGRLAIASKARSPRWTTYSSPFLVRSGPISRRWRLTIGQVDRAGLRDPQAGGEQQDQQRREPRVLVALLGGVDVGGRGDQRERLVGLEEARALVSL